MRYGDTPADLLLEGLLVSVHSSTTSGLLMTTGIKVLPS